jgi:hypothetical protein
MVNKRAFDNKNIGLTTKELAVLKRLNTPQKIQDFVSAIPQNFERDGDSCMSVREVLKWNRAHCIEGALIAALAFWFHGERPLLVDLSANDEDNDHIIAVFKINGYWGAISKGNHAYGRYRDPIYRTLRELVMSYFHEYYNPKGNKTLRTYSRPLDLSHYKPEEWITGKDSWNIASDICGVAHYRFISKQQEKILKPVDDIQLRITKLTVHK